MGAWGSNDLLPDGYYKCGMNAPNDTPLAYAILAWKVELAYNGAQVTMSNNPTFGTAMRTNVRQFQQANGAVVDGILGPQTALLLLRKRASALEGLYKIPNHFLAKLKSLESANDISAQGAVDPDDHGLVQINLRIHLSITLAQSIDPAYSLNYAGRSLSDAAATYKDWDVAIAGWNVGFGSAALWQKAGKPATGGTASFPDLYSRATRYAALVKAQSY